MNNIFFVNFIRKQHLATPSNNIYRFNEVKALQGQFDINTEKKFFVYCLQI